MSWKDNLENTFALWSKPASDNEEEKCDNALNMVKDAIKKYENIKNAVIEFILQGSYHNNTNVRLNSDVDICVKLKSSIFYTLPDGMKKEDVGLTNASYTFENFRDDVESALVSKFGRQHVKNGNKAFDIKSNTYRVEADVVACLEHRRYNADGTYEPGTQFYSRDGNKVVNFPVQHHSNGIQKNNLTGRSYKRLVRTLKRLKMQMQEDKVQGLDNISSFLIECLVWNIPNHLMNKTTYTEEVRDGLVYLYQQTKEDASCNEWGEVSELLYLFRPSRKYTRSEVNAFTVKAYNYLFD